MPGWRWPSKRPSYILEDADYHHLCYDSSWEGDPSGLGPRLDSLPPRSITEEQLKYGPCLEKRVPHYVSRQERIDAESAVVIDLEESRESSSPPSFLQEHPT